MRPCAALLVLAIGCGHSGSSTTDGAVGDSGGNGDSILPFDGSLGGGTQIHVTLTNRPDNAAMFSFIVAYQDGSGPWQLAGTPNGDTYTFSVNSPSYAVAWTCNAGALRTVSEAAFAVAERTSLTFAIPARCTDRAPATTYIQGTVANRQGGLYAVNFGANTGVVGTQGYRVETPAGTHDAVLRHFSNSGGGSTSDVVVDETVVDRGVAVNGPTNHAMDASLAVATQAFPVDIALTNTARAQASTILYTAGGTTVTLVRQSQSFSTESLDATQMMTGDVYDQQILVAGNGQTSIVTNATATPAAQTYSAPTPLGGATATIPATTPYPQIETTWAPYDNVVGYAWAATQQPPLQQCGGNTPCAIVWGAILSPGVTGGSPGYRMPDLSALAGWDPALGFVAGSQVTGTAEADTSSAGASDFPAITPPAEGTQRVIVRSDFTVMP